MVPTELVSIGFTATGAKLPFISAGKTLQKMYLGNLLYVHVKDWLKNTFNAHS